MQTVLHKTASMAMDKGVEVLAAKYPIAKVIAPQIKKFSKPLMNAAHSKINKMFNKDEETEAGTTVATEEKAAEEKAVEEKAPKETEAEEEAVEEKEADEKENDKPSLMDKFKKAVGMEKEKGEEEEGEKEEAVEEKEVPKHDKKRKEAEQSDEPAPKKSRKSE